MYIVKNKDRYLNIVPTEEGKNYYFDKENKYKFNTESEASKALWVIGLVASPNTGIKIVKIESE